MNWDLLQTEAIPTLALISGNFTTRYRGILIKLALSVYGIVKGETEWVVPSTCIRPFRTIQGGFTCSIRRSFGEIHLRRIICDFICTKLINGAGLAVGLGSLVVGAFGSEPFRRFYEALGGQRLRDKQINVGGVQLVEVAYGLAGCAHPRRQIAAMTLA